MQRRTFVTTTAVAAFGTMAGVPAWAQKISGDVRMLCGFAPGGTADLLCRILAEAVQSEVAQKVIVYAKTGASGFIANEAVANSTPDGRTIGLAAMAAMCVSPVMPGQKLPINVDTDLTPASSSTNPNYWYYASRRETDANGVPTQKQAGAAGAAAAIDWSQLPIATTTAGGSVQVRMVIDRLCNGPPPVTDLLANCFAEAGTGGSGSKKAGTSIFTATLTVYYRLTARVTGPRNTVSMVQAILSR